MALTRKQSRFVSEYLKDMNATQAAIRAGYSKKSADVDGPRLLGNAGVKAAVDAGLQRATEKAEITVDWVLSGVKRIGDDQTADKFAQLKAFELGGKYLKLWTEKVVVEAGDSFATLLKEARARAQRE